VASWDLIRENDHVLCLILGRGRMGKTYYTRQLYHQILCTSFFDQVILFDPAGQIDRARGFRQPGPVLARLESMAKNPDRSIKTALVVDESEFIFDQWKTRDDIRDQVLTFNRHMGLALYLNSREQANNKMLRMATDLVLFSTMEKDLVDIGKKYAEVDPSTFGVGEFVHVKL
jgi:hypothetical protein